MAKAHYDFTYRNFGILVGFIISTALLVSLLYGALYGFDMLGQEMNEASKLMTAAFNRPAIMPAPGTTLYGPGTQHPAGLPYGQRAFQQGAQGQPTGQYVCPQHGAVGLPRFDAGGIPHCPIDGQIMMLSGPTGP